MVEQLLESEFAPAILKPTCVTYTTSSLIDNIFVKSRRLSKHYSYVLLEAMSDHYPCLLSLPLKCDVEGNSILEKRNLSDEAIQKIQQDLLFYPWDDLSEIPVNISYPYLVNVITKMLDKHASKKKVTIKSSEKFREPWMTLSIKRCNQKNRKLCKLAKNSKLRKDYDHFKQYRNALNHIKLSEKRQHYKDLFKKIGRNSVLLWNVKKGLIKRCHNKSDITGLLYQAELLTGDKSIADGFNDHFVNAGHRVHASIKQKQSNFDVSANVKHVENTLKFTRVSELELCRIVENLKLKKSSGLDGISNVLLKKLIPVIKKPLCQIVNMSLLSGSFPDLMKIAKVIPLFKSGDCKLPDNYRPISLLSVLSKVIEKVVYKKTVVHLNKEGIIYPKQFGFRKKDSTIDAVMNLTGEILNAFENNLMVMSVFIDLKKAFDMVNHCVILKKLEKIGIRGLELQWFQDYLTNQRQIVNFNGIYSNIQTLSIGIQQGSLLGVLLFQIIISDLPKALKLCSSILYADDTTIYVMGKSLRFLKLTRKPYGFMQSSFWVIMMVHVMVCGDL